MTSPFFQPQNSLLPPYLCHLLSLLCLFNLMATLQQNGALMHGDPELEDGCCCFRGFGFTTRRHIIDDEDELHLLRERREQRESWVFKQLKKLKVVSELVAGPKWKNFIRRIGAYFNAKKRKDFQYDSFNYTLNFDDGIHDDDQDGAALGFSSRFAPPVQDKPRSTS